MTSIKKTVVSTNSATTINYYITRYLKRLIRKFPIRVPLTPVEREVAIVKFMEDPDNLKIIRAVFVGTPEELAMLVDYHNQLFQKGYNTMYQQGGDWNVLGSYGVLVPSYYKYPIKQILMNRLFNHLMFTRYSSLNKVYFNYPFSRTITITPITEKEQKKPTIYSDIGFMSLTQAINYGLAYFSGQNVQHKRFYELGSGSGRGVMIAGLAHDFKECIGLEKDKEMYTVAKTALRDKIDSTLKIKKGTDSKNREFTESSLYPNFDKTQPNLRYVHANFIAYDWSNGDVIYTNATNYDQGTMNSINTQANKCKKNTIFITVGKQLKNTNYKLIQHAKARMSWGDETVYVYIKKT